MMRELADAMDMAGLPPEFAYAFQKTGLILMEGEDYAQVIRDEYNAAIEEYFELEKAGKLRPKS